MSLKRITDKNFLPPEGSKPIPVYSSHFNDAYDALYRMNARAHHSMDVEKIVKYPLMAVAVYNFDVDGGATGTLTLNSNIGLVPDNAVIRNVFYDTPAAVTTTGATATVICQLPTDGALLTFSNVGTGAAAVTGGALGLGTPQNSTAGTWVKTTAIRTVQVDITGAGTVVTGKVYCYIEYVVSELEASDYSV